MIPETPGFPELVRELQVVRVRQGKGPEERPIDFYPRCYGSMAWSSQLFPSIGTPFPKAPKWKSTDIIRRATHCWSGQAATPTTDVKFVAVETWLAPIFHVLHLALLLSKAANPASFEIFQGNQRD